MRPITSYAVILYAAMLHGEEARIILRSHNADGSVGIHALLAAIPDRYTLAAALLASAAAAVAALLWGRRLRALAAMALLLPQQILLVVTAGGAWLAIWQGMYPDAVPRPSDFIECDQMPRAMFSLLHVTATVGLIMYLDRRRDSRSADRSAVRSMEPR